MPAAGSQLANDIKAATINGSSAYVVPPGVYRITNAAGSLSVHGTHDFSIYGAGVELIAELDNTLFSIENNINLTIQGAACALVAMTSAACLQALSFCDLWCCAAVFVGCKLA